MSLSEKYKECLRLEKKASNIQSEMFESIRSTIKKLKNAGIVSADIGDSEYCIKRISVDEKDGLLFVAYTEATHGNTGYDIFPLHLMENPTDEAVNKFIEDANRSKQEFKDLFKAINGLENQ